MRTRDKLVNKIDGKRIDYKFLQYYQSHKGLSTVRTLILDSDLVLQFRNGKYRYRIMDMDYPHYSHYVGSQARIYQIGGKCSANGSLHRLQNIFNRANGSRKEALLAIHENINHFLNEMNEGIVAGLNEPDENDW